MSKDADSWRLAVADLMAVAHVAQVLREMPAGRQAVLLSEDRTYKDPYLLRTLETGLVVTYVRVFTSSRRYTPVPPKWIPEEHKDLHEFLLGRRNRYDAHIDRREMNQHPRPVADEGDGWFSIGYPDQLSPAQLEELVELVQKLHHTIAANLPS